MSFQPLKRHELPACNCGTRPRFAKTTGFLSLSHTVNAKRRLVNPVSRRWCSSVVAIISSQLACTDGSGVHISVLVGWQSSYLHEQN
jgi:hypothetical protein